MEAPGREVDHQAIDADPERESHELGRPPVHRLACLLYTSDAADERSSVDLGGRRIIKKKNAHTASGVADSGHTLTETRKCEM